MTDVAGLNRRILLDPRAVSDPGFSPLLLHEEPFGGHLHPLAKGLALLELHSANADVGKLRECYESGIPFCFVSGITAMDPSGGSDTEHGCMERVADQIEVLLAGRTIVLEFESTGSMTIMGVTTDKHYPVALDEFLADEPAALASPAALHAAWAATRRAEPFAYPEDSGWEIGGIRWKLTKIGGLPVDGPEISDYNLGWDDDCVLSDSYKQRYQEYEQGYEQAFCLLHYLDEGQARELGLARPDGSVGQPAGKVEAGYYPDGVRDDLDLEATWITRDQLIESYRDSTLLFDTLTVFIGASETARMVEDGWRTPVDELDTELREAMVSVPGDGPESGEDHGSRLDEAGKEGEESGDASSKAADALDPGTRLRPLHSLFAFQVNAANASLPPALTRIVENLQRLRRAAFPEGG
jgi:hypothetical protein